MVEAADKDPVDLDEVFKGVVGGLLRALELFPVHTTTKFFPNTVRGLKVPKRVIQELDVIVVQEVVVGEDSCRKGFEFSLAVEHRDARGQQEQPATKPGKGRNPGNGSEKGRRHRPRRMAHTYPR